MIELDEISLLLEKMENGVISPLEYRNLQNMLIRNLGDIEKYYPICTTSIKDNKVLFISDTHIGSEYESNYFMYNAYNFAVKNNIKTVIHLGDLIEGNIRNRGLTYEEARNQLVNAINYVCSYGLNTKLLLGNHDFSIVNQISYKKVPNLMREFCETNSLLDILGVGRVLLDWNGVRIGLNHYISKKLLKFKETSINEDLIIKGHAHWYHVLEGKRVISLPSLSTELKDKTYLDSKDLKEFGYNLSQNTPYMNFIKAEFVEDGVILFQEYAEKDGFIVPDESILFDNSIKTLRIKNKRKFHF